VFYVPEKDEWVTLHPEKLNYVDAKVQPSLFDQETWQVNNIDVCIPRPAEKKFMRRATKKSIDPWEIPKSLFKDYKVDTESLLNECFEFDWGMIKKFKTISALEEIKEALRKAYLPL